MRFVYVVNVMPACLLVSVLNNSTYFLKGYIITRQFHERKVRMSHETLYVNNKTRSAGVSIPSSNVYRNVLGAKTFIRGSSDQSNTMLQTTSENIDAKSKSFDNFLSSFGSVK